MKEGIKEESEYCGSIEKSKNVIKYNNMMRHKNIVSSEKAVTLVALVVTIVVLLILAGVSLAMLAGDNGNAKLILMRS